MYPRHGWKDLRLPSIVSLKGKSMWMLDGKKLRGLLPVSALAGALLLTSEHKAEPSLLPDLKQKTSESPSLHVLRDCLIFIYLLGADDTWFRWIPSCPFRVLGKWKDFMSEHSAGADITDVHFILFIFIFKRVLSQKKKKKPLSALTSLKKTDVCPALVQRHFRIIILGWPPLEVILNTFEANEGWERGFSLGTWRYKFKGRHFFLL